MHGSARFWPDRVAAGIPASMVRHSLTAVSIMFLVTACGMMAKPAPHAVSASAEAPKSRHPAKVSAESAPAEEHGGEASTAANAFRRVGDYHVYRYTGTFAKEPLTLTEQVVGMEGDAFLVDFVLEEGEKMTALRVRMHGDGEVLSVRRITDDGDVVA